MLQHSVAWQVDGRCQRLHAGGDRAAAAAVTCRLCHMCVLDDQLQQRLWVSVTSAMRLSSSCSDPRPRSMLCSIADSTGTQRSVLLCYTCACVAAGQSDPCGAVLDQQRQDQQASIEGGCVQVDTASEGRYCPDWSIASSRMWVRSPPARLLLSAGVTVCGG